MTKWRAIFTTVLEVKANTRTRAKGKAWLKWQDLARNLASNQTSIRLEELRE